MARRAPSASSEHTARMAVIHHHGHVIPLCKPPRSGRVWQGPHPSKRPRPSRPAAGGICSTPASVPQARPYPNGRSGIVWLCRAGCRRSWVGPNRRSQTWSRGIFCERSHHSLLYHLDLSGIRVSVKKQVAQGSPGWVGCRRHDPLSHQPP